MSTPRDDRAGTSGKWLAGLSGALLVQPVGSLPFPPSCAARTNLGRWDLASSKHSLAFYRGERRRSAAAPRASEGVLAGSLQRHVIPHLAFPLTPHLVNLETD